jgi:hypothetical protein
MTTALEQVVNAEDPRVGVTVIRDFLVLWGVAHGMAVWSMYGAASQFQDRPDFSSVATTFTLGAAYYALAGVVGLAYGGFALRQQYKELTATSINPSGS